MSNAILGAAQLGDLQLAATGGGSTPPPPPPAGSGGTGTPAGLPPDSGIYFPRSGVDPATLVYNAPLGYGDSRRTPLYVLSPQFALSVPLRRREYLPEPIPDTAIGGRPSLGFLWPFEPFFQFPYLPWDRTAAPVSERHQRMVAEILNALLREQELVMLSTEEVHLGYVCGDITAWQGNPPVTIYEALDRIAAALVSLGVTP